jgi:hypothetical protein
MVAGLSFFPSGLRDCMVSGFPGPGIVVLVTYRWNAIKLKLKLKPQNVDSSLYHISHPFFPTWFYPRHFASLWHVAVPVACAVKPRPH